MRIPVPKIGENFGSITGYSDFFKFLVIPMVVCLTILGFIPLFALLLFMFAIFSYQVSAVFLRGDSSKK